MNFRYLGSFLSVLKLNSGLFRPIPVGWVHLCRVWGSILIKNLLVLALFQVLDGSFILASFSVFKRNGAPPSGHDTVEITNLNVHFPLLWPKSLLLSRMDCGTDSGIDGGIDGGIVCLQSPMIKELRFG